jgi:hypothetical protein
MAVLQPHCLAQISPNPLKHINFKTALKTVNSVAISSTRRLAVFREMICIDFDIHTKHTNMPCF